MSLPLIAADLADRKIVSIAAPLVVAMFGMCCLFIGYGIECHVMASCLRVRSREPGSVQHRTAFSVALGLGSLIVVGGPGYLLASLALRYAF